MRKAHREVAAVRKAAQELGHGVLDSLQKMRVLDHAHKPEHTAITDHIMYWCLRIAAYDHNCLQMLGAISIPAEPANATFVHFALVTVKEVLSKRCRRESVMFALGFQ